MIGAEQEFAAVTGVTPTMRYVLGDLVWSTCGRKTARELGASPRTLVALSDRGLADERIQGWAATSFGERWLTWWNDREDQRVLSGGDGERDA